MSLRDWFLFISTLVMGMLTGMYIYFTTFVPEYIANPVVQEMLARQTSALTVTATAYGGCDQFGSCPRYELTDGGAYRYQPPAGRTEPVAIESGTLPNVLWQAVQQAVEDAPLPQLSRTADKTCTHWSDGIDYEFTISEAGSSVMLDTCFTQLNVTHPLTQTLTDVFTWLEDPASVTLEVSPDDGRTGVRGFLERKLDEAFSYDD